MNLFSLKKNEVIVEPQTLLIKEFKDIYNADKSKDKSLATKELAYVYFITDWSSVYMNFQEEERHEAIKEDLQLDPTWEPNHLVKLAIKKYDDLQQTPTMKYAKSIRKSFWDMVSYFDKIDYNERDARKQPVYKIQDVTKAMADAGKLMDSINKIEDTVKREQSEGRTKGGHDIGLFEDHDKEPK